MIIDNRGGAAGVIGTRVAARAAPDGYTLVMATSGSIAINPNLYVNPGYQTLKDLAPIRSDLDDADCHDGAPVITGADPGRGDRYGEARPEQDQHRHAAAFGTSANLGAELLKSLAGIDYTIVTYRGTGPLTTDLLGGHVKLGSQRAGAGHEQSQGRHVEGRGNAFAQALQPSSRCADLG